MARRATLTNETLLALGPVKLAGLVLDEAETNAAFRKIVTAALAGLKGPDAVASIIDRRLASLEKARGFIDWQKRRAFGADLKATLATIADELGRVNPAAAAERLLRFLACAEEVLGRVDDSSGQVHGVFEDAASALAALARAMPEDEQKALIEAIVRRLTRDGHGLIAAALEEAIPTLAQSCLTHADVLIAASLKEVEPASAQDWAGQSRRASFVRVRQAIADQVGDVDAFIALERERSGRGPDAIEVAKRLLAAGRASEALGWIRKPGCPGLRVMSLDDLADETSGVDRRGRDRAQLEVSILAALGQHDAAQDLRWRTFEATLDVQMLREHLRHLPDFEDVETLERAFAHAAAKPERYGALAFFLSWPRLDLAAKIVVDHHEGWDGRHYTVLVPAAEALEHNHPVAAAILYRALVDDVLARARSPAYGHAARHLARLDELSADAIAALGRPVHSAYRTALKQTHGRKAAFWAAVNAATVRK